MLGKRLTDAEYFRKFANELAKGKPQGVCISIPHVPCQICTRPLYGREHQEWHVRDHAEKLGLTYP